MKGLALAVCLWTAICLSAGQITFSEWKAEFGEQAHFADDNEHVDREQVFNENLKRIQRLNVENTGAEFTVNQFAAMTPQEFRRHVLMAPKRPVEFEKSRYAEPLAEDSDPLPESFDWRDHGMVSSVKDQGALGTCWAFSTVANIEGQWGMKKNSVQSLSVEQIVDCDDEKDAAHGRADCGVFGGWPYLAYEYVKKAGGLETDEAYAYCTSNCFPCAPKDYNVSLCGIKPEYCRKNDSCPARIDPSKFVPGLQVVDWKAISQNETEIARQLVALGPLSVAINGELLNFYHSGVWHPPFCSPDALDHAVLIVGYGVEKDLLSSKPYWIVKNSWGNRWGQKGYFKMMRGEGTCGINTQVTTAVLK